MTWLVCKWCTECKEIPNTPNPDNADKNMVRCAKGHFDRCDQGEELYSPDDKEINWSPDNPCPDMSDEDKEDMLKHWRPPSKKTPYIRLSDILPPKLYAEVQRYCPTGTVYVGGKRRGKTDQERAQIVAKYRELGSIKAVARELKISRYAIRSALRAAD